jgi:bacillithiol biosynthesis cysteine-adding enzyme BshC
MHCTCVRHTELPNTSALFADVLYHPDRTAAFYRHPYRELTSFQAAAREVHLPDERRAALVAALREQNGDSQSLDRLASRGTVAVVTGQQVGLFSGPAYTMYKVLHAVKLAEWLSANGLPAVPVFWLATEDHDFAEVNHVWVFNAQHKAVKLEMRRTATAQPVGDIALAAPPVDGLREALRGLPFADEVTDLVAESYRPGETMGGAFGGLLRKMLARFDVLQVDPIRPSFRRLAAPLLQAAVKAAPELTAAVLERNRLLNEAGYHAQVHVEEQTSFVFLLENGKRLALRRHGDEYVLNGRRFTSAELADRAEFLSPNAILRPVAQDFMLPTVAYIGGPAEIAYLAQSAAIYERLLGRMPVATPRTGFTVLDSRTDRLMERYGLSLRDLFQGPEPLRDRVARKLVPPEVRATGAATRKTVEAALDRLRGELTSFDPTLAGAAERSLRKVGYQFEKLDRKIGREALRRDEQAARDAASIYGLIYPERHLQERLYSFLPLLAKHGLDLTDRVYQEIQLDCPDHRLMVV